MAAAAPGEPTDLGGPPRCMTTVREWGCAGMREDAPGPSAPWRPAGQDGDGAHGLDSRPGGSAGGGRSRRGEPLVRLVHDRGHGPGCGSIDDRKKDPCVRGCLLCRLWTAGKAPGAFRGVGTLVPVGVGNRLEGQVERGEREKHEQERGRGPRGVCAGSAGSKRFSSVRGSLPFHRSSRLGPASRLQESRIGSH